MTNLSSAGNISYMPKVVWFVAFAISVPAALVASVMALAVLTPKSLLVEEPRVLAAVTGIYDARGGENGSISTQVTASDARGLIIKNYLQKYDSPLVDHYQDVVTIADKYQLDPNLLVAIAQQESNLCKRIPADSYNCWGYGIYGDMVLRFDSYPQALDRVASGIKTDYLEQGLDTPEKIMAKYTPPSVEIGGPWAAGVNQFLEELR